MSGLVAVLTTVGPSVGVGLIFFFVIRAVLRADRREREYLRELDEIEVEAERLRKSGQHQESATPERSVSDPNHNNG